MSKNNPAVLSAPESPAVLVDPSSGERLVIPGGRYNDYAFEPILHQNFNKLRARLLNLAETSTRDRQQSEAMKGLVKDFVNESYFACVREIEDFLRDKGVIPKSSEPRPDCTVLGAQSMKDILYEPNGD